MTTDEWQTHIEDFERSYAPHDGINWLDRIATEPLEIASWSDFTSWFEVHSQNGCFRGQADSSWLLHTSLDRAVSRTHGLAGDLGTYSSVSGQLNLKANQQDVLAQFQAEAHKHCNQVPAHDDVADWLALMQHYGAPTRFLDWTMSPYVALYFAVEKVPGNVEKVPGNDAALWAIDLDWLKERSQELLEKYFDYPSGCDESGLRVHINRIIGGAAPSRRLAICPSLTYENDRLKAQQGKLLCSLDPATDFAKTIVAMLHKSPYVKRQVVSKISIKKHVRIQFLEELDAMGVHRAALFPGLDGFAKSLAMKLERTVEKQKEEIFGPIVEGMKFYKVNFPSAGEWGATDGEAKSIISPPPLPSPS